MNREWDRLYIQHAVVAELVQSSKNVQEDMAALRDYILAEVRRAMTEGPEEQIPEDIVEAVFPTARVLLLREVLENSTDLKRAQAYRDLTAPFADIVPK